VRWITEIEALALDVTYLRGEAYYESEMAKQAIEDARNRTRT
jgi:hypothetical protein